MNYYHLRYFLLMGLLGVLSWLVQDRHWITLFLCFLFLPLVSGLWTKFASAHIKISYQAPGSSCPKNQLQNLIITVHNKGFFFVPFVSFSLIESFGVCYEKKSIFLSIPPKSKQTFVISFSFSLSGMFVAGSDSIYIMDFLKLFCFKTSLSAKSNILVLPERYSITLPLEWLTLLSVPPHLSRMNRLIQPRFHQTANHDRTDYKSYQPQDHPKRIHWKLSLNHQELMVKHDIASPEATFIFLFALQTIPSQEDQHLQDIDRILNLSLSLIWHHIQLNDKIQVMYHHYSNQHQAKQELLASVSSFEHFYHHSPMILCNPQLTLSTLLSNPLLSNIQNAVLYLPIVELDSSFSHQLMPLLAQNNTIILIDCSEAPDRSKQKKQLPLSRLIQYYTLSQLQQPYLGDEDLCVLS